MRIRQSREKLLKAAPKVFSTKGYASASVSDIIAEAGVARGTFYLYFESKRNASVNGRVNQPNPGVFHIAAECGASLVPVYLKGFLKLYSQANPGFHFSRL